MNNFNKDDLYGYQVQLYKLSEEQGGGWGAEVAELKGCLADGETPEEAINNLKEVVDEWVHILRENGKPLPQPIVLREKETYSGKFTVRVPKYLHRLIAERAEQEDVSLNQLINSILAYHLGTFDKSIDEQAAVKADEVTLEWKISMNKSAAQNFIDSNVCEANSFMRKIAKRSREGLVQ